MRVLVGLECSGIIRDAFINAGHDAYSCDLKESETKTDRHLVGDVRSFLREGWDMLIAHPVCTYNARSGAMWYYHPEDKLLPKEKRRPHPLYPDRREKQAYYLQLFKELWNAPIHKICLENPLPLPEVIEYVGNYHQKIQPFYFGDSFQKTTCLWLKNLPQLIPNKIVHSGEFIVTKSGKRIPKWYSDAKTSDKEKTQTERSRTFPGIAKAMAAQWGNKQFENYSPTFFQ